MTTSQFDEYWMAEKTGWKATNKYCPHCVEREDFHSMLYLRVRRGLHRMQGDAILNWIFMNARDLAKDRMRYDKPLLQFFEHEAEDLSEDDLVADPKSDFEGEVLTAVALTHLTSRERAVVVGRLNGLKLREIAEQTGVDRSTVIRDRTRIGCLLGGR